jgi:hypothetical protein
MLRLRADNFELFAPNYEKGDHARSAAVLSKTPSRKVTRDEDTP